jgi:hypothetical protein
MDAWVAALGAKYTYRRTAGRHSGARLSQNFISLSPAEFHVIRLGKVLPDESKGLRYAFMSHDGADYLSRDTFADE